MRFLDLLYGIAIGDAVGNPLEFMQTVTEEDARRSYNSGALRISDDTQMTLFCAEALSEETIAEMVAPHLSRAYLRWLETQSQITLGDGLSSFKSLHHAEAPGNTCISALTSIKSGKPVLNDSKGNGTVMRCAPVAFWGSHLNLPRSKILRVAELDAQLTHKHEYAAQCSVLLTEIYLNLIGGLNLRESVTAASQSLQSQGLLNEYVHSMVLGCLDASEFKRNKVLLGGWVAEEALALAIGAVINSGTYLDAIYSAVSIEGDSDTVGAIAGGLAVASGMPVPAEAKSRLNAQDAIEYMGNSVNW